MTPGWWCGSGGPRRRVRSVGLALRRLSVLWIAVPLPVARGLAPCDRPCRAGARAHGGRLPVACLVRALSFVARCTGRTSP